MLDVEFREEQAALEVVDDGKGIILGLVARNYSDEHVRKIAGGNALAQFRQVMGRDIQLFSSADFRQGASGVCA